MRLDGRQAVSAAAAGCLVLMAEAAARFGWLGAPPARGFPPEVVAERIFAWVPLGLFSVAISVLGKSAKWLAFAGAVLLWTLATGWAIERAVALTARLGLRGGPFRWLVPGAAAALLTELFWRGVAPLPAWAGSTGGATLPAALLVAGSYVAAAFIVAVRNQGRWVE